MSAAETPESIYRSRLAGAQEVHDALASRSRVLSRLRLLVFALLAVAVVQALYRENNLPYAVTSLLLLVLFVALVVVHGRVARKLAAVRAVIALQSMRIAAHGRVWSGLPAVRADRANLPHWASELNVTGDVSLLRLLSGALTAPGKQALENFLFDMATDEEIAMRQEGVRELAARLDLLDDIQVASLLAPHWPQRALTPFLEWAETGADAPAAAGADARTIIARIVTAAVIVSALLYGGNVITAKWPVLILIISSFAAVILGVRARREIDAAEGKSEPMQGYGEMLAFVESASFTSASLRELQHEMGDQSARASHALLELRQLLSLAEVKYSPMMYMVLQMGLLWDVHLNDRFGRWRRAHGPHVRRWLGALGEVEALSALAALSHANPDWVFPRVSSRVSDGVFAAKKLAHPLLAADIRVANDVSVGPPGTFLLVTGSNMSGKSTLLRSIGLNSVLAQAGGPVCATSLTMPRVWLATSVQVQDSLAEGVSRFMAEVLRLREVVTMVREAEDPETPLPLYLLDEILQGTNTAERQAGARGIIEQLLRSRCIGVITTHDLALAASPSLSAAATAVHFTEGVDEEEGRVKLSFEYQLQPGLATSVNALKLMRAVGLDV